MNRTQINKKLKELNERDDVLILGQYVEDPFGGAAKVTRGIKGTINLPISEAGGMGFCTGLAMAGYKPIYEVMFFDFITLIADQVINIFANIDQDITVVIRTMKAPEIYGPTHSKDMRKYIEKWPVHVRFDGWAEEMDYDMALERRGITILVEDKNGY